MDFRSVTDQIGRSITVPFAPKRIISVVPSQTELLFDLGLNEEVVGITKFCIHPESKFSSTAKVGGTKTLNIEKIRQLRPDLIIANKEENTKEQIDQLMQEFPVWVSDIHDLDSALYMVGQVGMMVDRQSQGDNIIAQIRTGFNSLLTAQEPLRVAYFIWKDPYMVAARDTFIESMLLTAGWENAFSLERYPEVSSEDIIAADDDNR